MVAFGGDWTKQKLGRVSKYLRAFVTALKKQRFDLVYVDAFSGDGGIELKGEELPLLEQGREFTEGSARRALQCNPHFDRYHFIDRSASSLEKLRAHVENEHPNLSSRIRYHHGDVNTELPDVVARLNRDTERAVVFADPFALQLDWETIEAVGAAIVDFWYLFPTMALNRVLARDGQLHETWVQRLDRFLGTMRWREEWYRASKQADLFGNKRIERSVNIDQIEIDVHGRLKTVFNMAPNKLRLHDGNRHLFTLMFGCSNPNPKGFGLAIKIANDLLKE